VTIILSSSPIFFNSSLAVSLSIEISDFLTYPKETNGTNSKTRSSFFIVLVLR